MQKAKIKVKEAVQELYKYCMDKLLKLHFVWDKENTTDDLLVDVKTIDDDDDDYDGTVDDYGLDLEKLVMMMIYWLSLKRYARKHQYK